MEDAKVTDQMADAAIKIQQLLGRTFEEMTPELRAALCWQMNLQMFRDLSASPEWHARTNSTSGVREWQGIKIEMLPGLPFGEVRVSVVASVSSYND